MNILQKGIDLMASKKYYEALSIFDVAINTHQIKEAYRERAYCLQTLGFHPDAIDDFTSALNVFPTHANCFYGRALSYGSLGHYNEALADIYTAISLSKIDSEENHHLDKIAKNMGYENTTSLYQMYLSGLIDEMNETDEISKAINIKKPVRRPR